MSEEKEENKKPKETIRDSVAWVVNMMNEGKADPKDVYPGGSNRYHGD